MLKNKNKFDKLFKNVSPTSMSGIQIFGIHDKYIKPQKYNDGRRGCVAISYLFRDILCLLFSNYIVNNADYILAVNY